MSWPPALYHGDEHNVRAARSTWFEFHGSFSRFLNFFPSKDVIIIIIINIKDWTSLIRSVSRVTTVLANVSSVFQLFSFPVVCSGMISKGFGFVAFFASVNASSVCIHLSCLACL